MLNNNIQSVDNIIRRIEQLLADIKIESSLLSKFTRLNIYILKNIFYEFFFFEGFSKLGESDVPLDYELIIRKTGSSEEFSSAIIFKIVAWLELQQRSKEGFILLNHMLNFYLTNQQKQKAFFIVVFMLNYANKNSVTDVDQEYYNKQLDDLLNKMNESEEVLRQLSSLTREKYEKFIILIKNFDIETEFRQRDLKLLKAIFLENIKSSDKERIRNASDLRFYCYIFNENDYYSNLNNIDKKIRYILYMHYPRIFFSQLKYIISKFKLFHTFYGNFYVLKFHTSSKGYNYRYLKVNRKFLAVVSEKHKDKISIDHKQRGVCKFIR